MKFSRGGYTESFLPPLTPPPGVPSNVWPAIVREFRKHRPVVVLRRPGMCIGCGGDFPCPAWIAFDRVLASLESRAYQEK